MLLVYHVYKRLQQQSTDSISSNMKVLVVFALLVASAVADLPGYLNLSPDSKLISNLMQKVLKLFILEVLIFHTLIVS